MQQTYTVGARSLFVTLTAWALMALALMASASAVVQNAAVASLALPQAMPGEAMAHPVLARWLLAYLPWVVGAGLVLSVGTLVAALGLLLRREWARRVCTALVLVAIAVNLGGLWLQQAFMLSVVDATLQAVALTPKVADVFVGFVLAARSMAALVTLGGCALLAWVAWRLQQPMIRQEFA